MFQYSHLKAAVHFHSVNSLNDTKYYLADYVKYHMHHCETFSTQGPKKFYGRGKKLGLVRFPETSMIFCSCRSFSGLGVGFGCHQTCNKSALYSFKKLPRTDIPRKTVRHIYAIRQVHDTVVLHNE